jgi:hypothetical protein
VPLGQPAPPLLSVWSGPQPPAQLSLGQERHVSRAPWGVVGWAGARNGGAVPVVVAGRKGYELSAGESLSCLPTAMSSPRLGNEVAEGCGE